MLAADSNGELFNAIFVRESLTYSPMILIFSEDGGARITESQTEAVAQCEGIDSCVAREWFILAVTKNLEVEST